MKTLFVGALVLSLWAAPAFSAEDGWGNGSGLDNPNARGQVSAEKTRGDMARTKSIIDCGSTACDKNGKPVGKGKKGGKVGDTKAGESSNGSPRSGGLGDNGGRG